MEGPLLKVITENLVELKGKKVVSSSGNAKIEIEIVEGKEIKDVFGRGKNLFIKFSNFAIKLHSLMAGSYRLNEEKEGAIPRISLVFEDGMFNFYGGTIKIISNEEIEELYNEEVDITSDNWNLKKVLNLASKKDKKLICDVLLDQGQRALSIHPEVDSLPLRRVAGRNLHRSRHDCCPPWNPQPNAAGRCCRGRPGWCECGPPP